MYVYIDESGDAGFKLHRGSTPFFVVAMVLIPDAAAISRIAQAVSEVREGTRHKTEFKFSACSFELRDAYFGHLVRERFSVRAIVVDKSKIYSPHLREVTESFYNYFVRMLMLHDNGALTNAKVRIDARGGRKLQDELGTYLRRQAGEGKIRNVKALDSRRDELIQLADMCAGAIHRKFKSADRFDADRWYKKLQPRIEDVWTFPND